jgi:hypothetical protein
MPQRLDQPVIEYVCTASMCVAVYAWVRAPLRTCACVCVICVYSKYVRGCVCVGACAFAYLCVYV